MEQDVVEGHALLTAEEAAARLGVKRETIYAYVSRGVLTRHRDAGQRQSYFKAADVERLANRSRSSASETIVTPIFSSNIGTIQDGKLYFRGENAATLASKHLFEEVANFIWTGRLEQDARFAPDLELVAGFREVLRLLPGDLLPAEQIRCLLPVAGALDPMRHDLEAVPLRNAAARVIASIVEVLPPLGEPYLGSLDLGGRTLVEPTMAARLWSRLSSKAPTPGMLRALNAALVVTADHSATSHSTVVARLAASRRATIYSVIAAALESGGGPVRASASLAIELYLRNITRSTGVSGMLNERLLHGQELPGFGHRSYDKDPRVDVILEHMSRGAGRSEHLEQVYELLEIQRGRGLPPPNIGFAIAMLAYVADMLPGSGEVIFFISRAAGWVAHALEQYASGQEIRHSPTAYTGPEPHDD